MLGRWGYEDELGENQAAIGFWFWSEFTARSSAETIGDGKIGKRGNDVFLCFSLAFGFWFLHVYFGFFLSCS